MWHRVSRLGGGGMRTLVSVLPFILLLVLILGFCSDDSDGASTGIVYVDGAGYILEDDGTATLVYSTDDPIQVIPDDIQHEGISYVVDTIISGAFRDNVNLTSVTFGVNIKSVASSSFTGCANLQQIEFNNGLLEIGSYAFSECTSLKTVTLPATLVEMGQNPFRNCVSLESIEVEGGNTVYTSDDGVLYSIHKDTLLMYPAGKSTNSFEIPTGVSVISDYAFSGCTALNYVTIPSSVKQIGNYAFSYTGLLSVKVPNSVTELGQRAFYECHNLRTANIGSGIKVLDSATFMSSGLSQITLPYGLQSIGSYCFANCHDLDSVILPSTLTSIGMYAFGLTGVSDVVLPDSVTNLELYAFYYCMSLGTLHLGSGISTFNTNIIIGANLEAISVSPNNTEFAAIDGVLYDKQVTTLIYYPNERSDSKYIVPSTLVSIPANAFDRCMTLGSIEVEVGNTAFTSDNGVLFNIVRTELIKYPPVKADSTYKVPQGVTRIEAYAFSGMRYPLTLTLCDDIQYIGDHAFSGIYTFTIEFVEGTQYIEFGGSSVFSTLTKVASGTPGMDVSWRDSSGEAVAIKGYVGSAIPVFGPSELVVVFDSEGGSSVEQITVSYGSAYGDLPEPTRVGYTFKGWYLESAPDVILTSSSLVESTQDHVLVALWVPNEYVVKFYTPDSSSSLRDIVVTFGEPYGDLPVPERDGYRFDYWTNIDNELINSYTIVDTAENHVLFANWTSSPSEPLQGNEGMILGIAAVIIIMIAIVIAYLVRRGNP